MPRRIFVALSIVLFAIAVTTLSAQVFPRTEFLDEITLTDGTTLTGVIVERVPEKYVEIELYGGSRFVLGFERIESIDRTANPDYAPTWIKVDRDAVSSAMSVDGAQGRGAAGDGVASGDEAGEEAVPRPMIEGGWMLGAYVGPSVSFWRGDDWDDFIDSFPDDDESRTVGNFGMSDAGASLSYVGKPAFAGDRPFMLGVRGAAGTAYRGIDFRVDDPFGYGDFEYSETVFTLQLPLELLVGVGGDRAAVLFGAGIGSTVIFSEPSYYADFEGSDEFDDDGTYDTVGNVRPIYSVSLNALVRFGNKWVGEGRLYYDGIIIPWDNIDRDVLYSALGLTAGIGYRFGS